MIDLLRLNFDTIRQEVELHFLQRDAVGPAPKYPAVAGLVFEDKDRRKAMQVFLHEVMNAVEHSKANPKGYVPYSCDLFSNAVYLHWTSAYLMVAYHLCLKQMSGLPLQDLLRALLLTNHAVELIYIFTANTPFLLCDIVHYLVSHLTDDAKMQRTAFSVLMRVATLSSTVATMIRDACVAKQLGTELMVKLSSSMLHDLVPFLNSLLNKDAEFIFRSFKQNPRLCQFLVDDVLQVVENTPKVIARLGSILVPIQRFF